MFRNIRGQIASTMTWVIAFIIIFFIMFLFLIGVSSLHLNPLREKPTISLQENYRETLNDELNYQLLIFLQNHKTLISRWADDEVKLSISDLYDGKEDINMLALCKIIERDKEALGFFEFNHRKVYLIAGRDLEKNPSIYSIDGAIDSEEILLIEGSKEDFSCGPLPPNSLIVGADQTSLIRADVFFISKNENLVEAIYYGE